MRDRKEILSFAKLIFIFFFLLLSLLAKESGILFIIIILTYVYLFSFTNIRHITASVFMSLVVYCTLRLISSSHLLFVSHASLIQRAPFVIRLYSIPQIILYYISHFLLPIHLAVGQEWLVTKIQFSNFYLPLLIDILFFIIILLLGIYIIKKNRTSEKTYLFFSLWFFVGLSMHLQIFPLDQTVSDHWFYFPIIGLLHVVE